MYETSVLQTAYGASLDLLLLCRSGCCCFQLLRSKSGQEGGVPDDKEEAEEEVGEHGEEECQGQVVGVRCC